MKSFNELYTLSNDIDFYSVNTNNNLNIQNNINYIESLNTESLNDVIIIDMDSFNVNKVNGFLKKYKESKKILLIISDENKVNKFKDIVTVDCLLVYKNNFEQIYLTELVEQNIEKKRIFDEERKQKALLSELQSVDETINNIIEENDIASVEINKQNEDLILVDEILEITELVEETEETEETEENIIINVKEDYEIIHNNINKKKNRNNFFELSINYKNDKEDDNNFTLICMDETSLSCVLDKYTNDIKNKEIFNTLMCTPSYKNIIIDADDFNPGKINGFIKKYYSSNILILIENENKINKLLSCITANVLVLHKKTLAVIDVANFVEDNLKFKESLQKKKELEAEQFVELKEQHIPNGRLISFFDLINYDDDVSFYALDLDNFKKHILEKNFSFLLKNNCEFKDLLLWMPSSNLVFIDIDGFSFSKVIKIIVDNKDRGFILLSNDISKLYSVNDNIRDLNKDIILINKETFLPIDNFDFTYSVGHPHLNIEVIEDEIVENENIKIQTFDNKTIKNVPILKEVVTNNKCESLGVFYLDKIYRNYLEKQISHIELIRSEENKRFDFYVLDISLSSVNMLHYINRLMPAPILLFCDDDELLLEIDCLKHGLSYYRFDVNKDYSEDEFITEIVNYLNSYNLKDEEAKYKKYQRDSVPFGLEDNKYQSKIRKQKNIPKAVNEQTNIEENLEKEVKIYNKEETKQIIHENNKRIDKSLSLEQLYSDLGLDKLANFNTQINKSIYSMHDGQLIKYTPNGYLVEVRYERFKEQGLSDEEIRNAMERLEQSDIRFQQKQLRRVEIYKLQKEKRQKVKK